MRCAVLREIQIMLDIEVGLVVLTVDVAVVLLMETDVVCDGGFYFFH